MENASKALIIAGAILLSILIIGLGMFVFNLASGAMNDANLDPQKVSAYNSEFEQYEGTKSGTDARALCDLIRTHNNANVDDPSRQIRLKNTDASGEIAAPDAEVPAEDITIIKNNLRAGNTYTITFGYDANSGYIIACGIVKK